MILLKIEGFNVGISYVKNAVAKGAVCLDGSPPVYHLDKGFGAGINIWLVHIESFVVVITSFELDNLRWCNNVTTYLSLMDTCLGSSKKMAVQLVFSGILSNQQKFNPGSRLGTVMGRHLHAMWKQLILELKAMVLYDRKDVSGAAQIEAFYKDVVTTHGMEFLSALMGLDSSSSRGMFINSCYAHCQT
ncbi:unnamed protein product [Camellia sinensis]